MMRWLRRILALAIAVVLGVFAVVNRDPILVRFWPLPETATMPASAAILVGAAIGFLLGAVVVWGPSLSARVRLREAESRLRVLQPPPPVRTPGTALAASR